MAEPQATTFGVVGLGYVGLPLCVEAGKGGIRVLGFDVNETVVASVNKGRSHVLDVASEDVSALNDAGLLALTEHLATGRHLDVAQLGDLECLQLGEMGERDQTGRPTGHSVERHAQALQARQLADDFEVRSGEAHVSTELELAQLRQRGQRL